jgi:hypothetical protein
MSRANPLWGAPRIHGELQKLGLEISQAAVSKYRGRRSTPPSQTWRTFLNHHFQTLVSVDFFVVPTVLFKVLFVFVVLAHERRRVLHINVTDTPTAQWTAQQLVEAFPWETAPRYLLRDRDAVYGVAFSSRALQRVGARVVRRRESRSGRLPGAGSLRYHAAEYAPSLVRWWRAFLPRRRLARFEAQLAILAVVQRFPHLRLANEALEWHARPAFRGLARLRVLV